VSTLRPHDLDDRVIIVSASGMNGYPGRLVDDYHIVVLVKRRYGKRSDGRLMSMRRMRDDIPVLDEMFGSDRLTIDHHSTSFYRVFLFPLVFNITRK
jgi:hypothetical protein